MQGHMSCCGSSNKKNGLGPDGLPVNRTQKSHFNPSKIKLVLLGDSGVGKTCIVQRFASDEFSEDPASTIGVSFIVKAAPLARPFGSKTQVGLEMWDTAGQETYRSLLPLYYRGASIVVLVYDITNEDSLEQTKWWLTQVRKECGPDVTIALVGNKLDLAAEHRKVSTADVKAFADDNGFLHYEVSAKDNINIDAVFTGVATTALETRVKI